MATAAATPVWRSKLGREYPMEYIQRLDSEHQRILGQLRKVPGNDRCADCGAGNASWASVNLGVFVCVRCADLHRGLGTHISKPKGCNCTYLWGPDEIERMRQIGNHAACDQYPARQSSCTHLDPSWGKERQLQFCREKYGNAQLVVRQGRPSQQGTPDRPEAHAGAPAGSGPTQPQPRGRASVAQDSAVRSVDFFADEWLPGGFVARAAALEPAAREQLQSSSTLADKPGGCFADFDIDAFFDEHLPCGGAATPAVAEESRAHDAAGHLGHPVAPEPVACEQLQPSGKPAVSNDTARGRSADFDIGAFLDEHLPRGGAAAAPAAEAGGPHTVDVARLLAACFPSTGGAATAATGAADAGTRSSARCGSGSARAAAAAGAAPEGAAGMVAGAGLGDIFLSSASTSGAGGGRRPAPESGTDDAFAQLLGSPPSAAMAA